MAVTFPLTWPAAIVPRQIDWQMMSSVGQSRSPFTRQTQTQVHQGQQWGLQVDIPPLKRTTAQALIAVLAALNGMAGTILIGPTAEDEPLGAATGTPVVDGADQQGQDLETRGWTHPPGEILFSNAGVFWSDTTVLFSDVTPILKAGDWIQLGSDGDARLHRVLEDAWITDGPTGAATLSLWPSIQGTHADGAAVVTDGPVGAFKLAANDRGFSLGEAQFYGFTIPFVSEV